MSGLFGSLGALAPNYWLFLVSRFLQGSFFNVNFSRHLRANGICLPRYDVYKSLALIKEGALYE